MTGDFLQTAQRLDSPKIHVPKRPVVTGFKNAFVGFGSCFAQNLKTSLAPYGFEFWFERDISARFSPASIAEVIERIATQTPHCEDDLYKFDGRSDDIYPFGYYFKRRVYGDNAVSRTLKRLDDLSALCRQKIQEAETLIVTLGTARLVRFKSNDRLINSVFSIPKDEWYSEMQTVDACVANLHAIYNNFVKIREGKPFNLVITLSPQRYLFHIDLPGSDTFSDNTLSKAIVRVAIDTFMREVGAGNIIYFPSYEIIMDELRLFESISHYDFQHIEQDHTPKYIAKRFLEALANAPVMDRLLNLERLFLSEERIQNWLSGGMSPGNSRLIDEINVRLDEDELSLGEICPSYQSTGARLVEAMDQATDRLAEAERPSFYAMRTRLLDHCGLTVLDPADAWHVSQFTPATQHRMMCDAHLAKGEIEQAIAVLRKAIILYLLHGDLFKASDCLVQIGHIAKSTEVEWIERRHVANALYIRAQDSIRVGRIEAASRFLSSFLVMEPESALGHFLLGRVCAIQGKNEEGSLHAARSAMIQNKSHLDEKGRLPLSERQLEAIRNKLPSMAFIAQFRSASEYLSGLIAAAYGVQDYYNPTSETYPQEWIIPYLFEPATRGGAICRLHTWPSDHNIDCLRQGGFKSFPVHLRDPRQSTLSWMHFVVTRERDPHLLERHLFRHPYPDGFLDSSLEARLEWAIDYYYPDLVDWISAWVEREQELTSDFKITFTTHEEMVADPKKFLHRFVGIFDLPSGPIDRHFERYPADQQKNFRKGSVNEWKEVFNSDQKRRMRERLPASLRERFGWID
ncbi:MAG: GSCFA domain-containing protein [Alphaproteobacteria bacterium]|nr:GSCFA domain-containing protein [Alphaproteobacteria bacterium]